MSSDDEGNDLQALLEDGLSDTSDDEVDGEF